MPISLNGTTGAITGLGEILAGRVDSSNEGGQISLARSSDNASSWAIDVFGNTTSTSLRFIDVAANSVRMSIDSAGRIITPSQPRFYVYGPSAATSSATFLYQTISVNNGSHYSAATGRFTVPVNGTYTFFWSAIGNSIGDVYRYRLYKNGVAFNDEQVRLDTTATGSEFGFGQKTIITNASANDYFNIYYLADGASGSYINESYVSFGGYLLG